MPRNPITVLAGRSFPYEVDINKARKTPGPFLLKVPRIADILPHAGTHATRRRRLRTTCIDCRADCWLDPKRFDLSRVTDIQMICYACARQPRYTGGADG